MQTNPIMNFSNAKLVPLYDEPCAIEENINLAPGTYALGTVLGQITSTAADKQTFTATGTPTGGSFTFVVTNPITGATANLVIPFNANAAALQTLADAIFGGGNTVAGGGAWPGTALTLTGAGQLANVPIPVATASTNSFTGGTTPAASVAHTVVGRSKGTWTAYAQASGDGSEVPNRLLSYAITVDAAGHHYFGGQASSEFGQYALAVPSYIAGIFRQSDLVGLDANCVGKLCRVISGSIAGGDAVIALL